MKKINLCLLTVLACLSVRAQSHINGSVTDSSEHKNLSQSLITIIRETDSVLVGFTRTKPSGTFSLDQLPAGKMIVMITYPGYADYVDHISLSPAAPLDLGTVNMTLKSQLLQEVIISNAAPIRMKGDTIEYKADSFYMRAGASVEELLKKLPGIQVDKDGKITAQGETVKKVLVDGEEFFSDDPTVVTQNMLSEAVDKVQVYDKKSDQAAFTGVDDGKTTKTIDLKLKDDHKRGYFGKAEAGTDFKNFWNNNAMINAFRGKRKIAGYGVMSNTGRTGLDWRDNMTFAGGADDLDVTYEDGMTMISRDDDNTDDMDNSSYYGEGLPKGWNGGALYSNKWDDDKISLNGAYQFKKLNTAAAGNTRSKFILPDTLYYNNDEGTTLTSKFKHSLRGISEYKLDSSSSIKITAVGNTGQSSTFSHSYSEALNDRSALVNNSDRHQSSQGNNSLIATSLFYRTKLKKAGRTLSLSFSQNQRDNNSDGFLKADYNYYDVNGDVMKSTSTDQKKMRDNRQSNTQSRIVYTEPLSKRSVLEFNYGLSTARGHSEITTFQQAVAGSGKYETVVDSLTNDFQFNVLNNSAGVNFRYSKSKSFNYSFGGNVSRADYKRIDIKGDSSLSYHYINFFPRASLNLTTSGGGRFGLNYNGGTRPPTVDQIQPIRDNTNELDQRIGNTALKQSFNHRLMAYFGHFKLLSNRSIYMNVFYNATQNDISQTNYVDPSGKRIWQPVNVQGNFNLSSYFYYGKKLGKSPLNFNLDGSVNRNRNTNYTNGLKNITRSTNLSAGPGLSYYKEKKADFSFSFNTGYSWSTASLRPDQPTNYWTFSPRIDSRVTLPAKFEIQTDCNFNFRQKTDAFPTNNNTIVWNARLDRKFLKKDKGTLRIGAYDILDQNLNVDRNITSNFISERNCNAIRRHFMFSVIYNFNKNGQAPQ